MDYSKIDAVNWSTLKEMRRSPSQYRYRLDHPAEDTTRLAMGRAVHAAVFEPEEFAAQFAVFEGARRAGKEWEAFKATAGERTIIKADEFDLCLAVSNAVRFCPLVAPHLSTGRGELPLTWTDRETGLACKGRLDWLNPVVCLDLKTTTDVDARRFGALAYRYGYHCQAAFYSAGLRAQGIDVPYKLIAVEMEPPHEVALFDVGPDALYAGEEEVKELLARVAECRQANEWPTRYPVEQTLDLPAYAFNDEDADPAMGLVVGG